MQTRNPINLSILITFRINLKDAGSRRIFSVSKSDFTAFFYSIQYLTDFFLLLKLNNFFIALLCNSAFYYFTEIRSFILTSGICKNKEEKINKFQKGIITNITYELFRVYTYINIYKANISFFFEKIQKNL